MPHAGSLGEKVITVVRGVCDAKADINHAVKEKRDLAKMAKSLAEYRVAEREAVRASTAKNTAAE